MMRFASLFGVLQSSALKTAIVKKKYRRENLFIPIKTANFVESLVASLALATRLKQLMKNVKTL